MAQKTYSARELKEIATIQREAAETKRKEQAARRTHEITVERIRAEGKGAFGRAMVKETRAKVPLRAVETVERWATLTRVIVYFLGIFILYFVIIGPGVLALIKGLLEVSWYYWVAAIFILLLFLRRLR